MLMKQTKRIDKKRSKIMTNPHMTYQSLQARHKIIRHAEEAYRAAKQVQGEKPSRAKELLKSIVAFTKRISAQSDTARQTNETPQIQLSGEQA
jgi:predicted O-linked N-acetylglucosamine transferase (SPINDLY family)